MTHNVDVNLSIYENRHPSTQHMMKMLAPNVNLPVKLYEIAEDIFMLAHNIVLGTKDSPELTAGLRKLLEAKDCLVRANVDFEPVDWGSDMERTLRQESDIHS